MCSHFSSGVVRRCQKAYSCIWSCADISPLLVTVILLIRFMQNRCVAHTRITHRSHISIILLHGCSDAPLARPHVPYFCIIPTGTHLRAIHFCLPLLLDTIFCCCELAPIAQRHRSVRFLSIRAPFPAFDFVCATSVLYHLDNIEKWKANKSLNLRAMPNMLSSRGHGTGEGPFG